MSGRSRLRCRYSRRRLWHSTKYYCCLISPGGCIQHEDRQLHQLHPNSPQLWCSPTLPPLRQTVLVIERTAAGYAGSLVPVPRATFTSVRLRLRNHGKAHAQHHHQHHPNTGPPPTPHYFKYCVEPRRRMKEREKGVMVRDSIFFLPVRDNSPLPPTLEHHSLSITHLRVILSAVSILQ